MNISAAFSEKHPVDINEYKTLEYDLITSNFVVGENERQYPPIQKVMGGVNNGFINIHSELFPSHFIRGSKIYQFKIEDEYNTDYFSGVLVDDKQGSWIEIISSIYEERKQMNKTFRVSCTIDVHYEDTSLGAVDTLMRFVEQEGDNWCVDNVQVINVEEITEKEE